MGDVILFKEDVDQLNSLLKNLVDDAKILSAILITKDTRVLACQGTLTSIDTGALAALLVGSFASTQAIAGLIGETEFETLSHCGKTRNVVISLIDDNTILASIFDKTSSFDHIRSSVAKHLEVLKKVLHSIGGNTTHDLFDTGANATAANAVAEFEIRADALNKHFEGDQLSSAENINVQHVKKMEHVTPEPIPSLHTERSHKAPVQPQVPSHEIKRPPDSEMTTIAQTKHQEEEHVYREQPSEAAQAAIHGDSALRKVEQQPVSKRHEELVFENKPAHAARAPAPSSGSQTRESSTGAETFHMSMNYLKNKTREGALYYHHDKAFFKKFFKSSHKKKS